MLKVFRKKGVQKKILIALAIFIIPAFVFWGAGGLQEEKIQGYSYVGKIDGKKVTIKEFVNARKTAQIQLLLNYMGQKEVLEQLFKNKKLLNSITWDRLLLLNEAEQRRITVSNKEVIANIAQAPMFVHNGKFDVNAYNYFVEKSLGLSPRAFEEAIREFIMIDKVKKSIVANIIVKEKEVLEVARLSLEKAKLSYFIINNDMIQEKAEVSQDEIKSFYSENKKMFEAPEKRNLEYFEFNYSGFAEKKAVEGVVARFAKDIKRQNGKFALPEKESGQEVLTTGLLSLQDIVSRFSFSQKNF